VNDRSCSDGVLSPQHLQIRWPWLLSHCVRCLATPSFGTLWQSAGAFQSPNPPILARRKNILFHDKIQGAGSALARSS
jgi:hypothetical protein